jgi:hypothetical protein
LVLLFCQQWDWCVGGHISSVLPPASWATRKWMSCRKIFRAVVGPFEVNFCRVMEVQQT